MQSAKQLTEDGLPIDEVGAWVHEKHERLRRYVSISSKVRAKFTGGSKAGATYIDLYCGHGRSRIRGSTELVNGSTIVAALAAQSSGHAFSEIHVADIDSTAVKATAARIRAHGITTPVKQYVGAAEKTARAVVRRLGRRGLHVMFLDPYNLGNLPPSVLEAFSHLPRVDILIHVSAMDLQRNLEQAIGADEGHQFDVFAPGWRDAVDTKQPPHEVRRAIREYWVDLVRRMGFHIFEHQFPLIRGTRNQPLYWLAFAAKHKKASEFWDKIRNIEPQKGFGF
jgi:three-Cys-motif partner protein